VQVRLSELQHKDIVDLEGKKIGNIIDVILDNEGRLVSLVIEPSKRIFRFGNKETESEIGWDKIEKIGEDVILVRII